MNKGLKAVVWRKDKETLSYIFQISGKPTAINRACREIGGLSTGEGYNHRTKHKILLLVREFASKREWLKFVKSLSFELIEISSKTGKERILNERRKRQKYKKV